jgi:flagellar basal body-associated protein FliL
MRKKRTLLLLLLAIVCIATVMVYMASFANRQAMAEENQQGNSMEPPAEPFVVPESPLGTLGLTSAIIIAIGIFALKKRRQ